MNYALVIWPEAWKDFVQHGLPFQETLAGLTGEYTPDQIIGLSDRFDIMMRKARNEKTIHVAPKGRGFAEPIRMTS